MKRLSKWFYLGSIIGGLVVGIILFFIGLVLLVLFGILTSNYTLNFSYTDTWTLITCGVLILSACIAILYACSIWALLLYKAWAVIQDGHATTTAEKAVGFVFIPFYQLYWIFRAWYGFARDYNRLIENHSLTAPKMKEGQFLAFCILFICINVPYVTYVVGVPFIVMLAITSSQTIDGVNALLSR